MKAFVVILVLAASTTVQAAQAPFIQIDGAAPSLARTCSGSNTSLTVPVNVSIPANASYGFVVSYLIPDMSMNYMDMMMMPMGDMPVTLYMSGPRNGPVVDSAAPFSIGRVSDWYAMQSMVADHTLLQIAISAYTGPNGTGDVAATTTMTWDCASGDVQSVVHMGNATGTSPTSLAKAVAVEFYHAGLGHFFMSTNADEIAALQSGQITGWARTGQSFNVFAAAAAGASAVCRFYIPPDLGNSHFYSASSSECATVGARFPTFTLESPAVFFVAMPDQFTGSCPALSVPVYRLWNQRADSNHRYTTDRTLRNQMMQSGYVAEGYGADAVIMCSPQ